MVKESYYYEDSVTGYKENYDIEVDTDGIVSIMITDCKGRMTIPSWHLIQKLYESINSKLKYQEEARKQIEKQDEDE